MRMEAYIAQLRQRLGELDSGFGRAVMLTHKAYTARAFSELENSPRPKRNRRSTSSRSAPRTSHSFAWLQKDFSLEQKQKLIWVSGAAGKKNALILDRIISAHPAIFRLSTQERKSLISKASEERKKLRI